MMIAMQEAVAMAAMTMTPRREVARAAVANQTIHQMLRRAWTAAHVEVQVADAGEAVRVAAAAAGTEARNEAGCKRYRKETSAHRSAA